MMTAKASTTDFTSVFQSALAGGIVGFLLWVKCCSHPFGMGPPDDWITQLAAVLVGAALGAWWGIGRWGIQEEGAKPSL